MTSEVADSGAGRGFPWRIVGWSIPAILLVLPAVAMRFTDEVNWTASDFVFAAVLFGSVGFAFELIVRKSPNLSYRLGAALAVMGAFLTIWANGAVGMIGDEDNAYNLVFLFVLVLALGGAVVARFRPYGMAIAMAVTGTAQLAAGAGGFASDPRGAIFSMGFGGIWLLAAALFRNAADRSVGKAGGDRA